MWIGVPKEIKNHEYRVGVTPAMAHALVRAGHRVSIERDAGARIGYTNEAYETAGAQVVATAADAYQAEMIIKVKEPQAEEYDLLKEGQVLFTYLHLAPDPVQTEALLRKKVIGIAYETVTDDYGQLPLLVPMSEIAGRISIHAGANALHMIHGGRGVLLGGVPGVLPANVVVIGGGIVGTEAARMAMGLGARVTVLDTNLHRLREMDVQFGSRLSTRYSTEESIEESVLQADLVVGAVLIPGKAAPKLVSEDLVRRMKPGSTLVDVAIDQGGCFETSRATTHSAPTYIVDGVVHYCVANMPGACACTATQALTNATQAPALAIANRGWKEALHLDAYLREGLNVCEGVVTNQHVADDLGYEFVPPVECL